MILSYISFYREITLCYDIQHLIKSCLEETPDSLPQDLTSQSHVGTNPSGGRGDAQAGGAVGEHFPVREHL